MRTEQHHLPAIKAKSNNREAQSAHDNDDAAGPNGGIAKRSGRRAVA